MIDYSLDDYIKAKFGGFTDWTDAWLGDKQMTLVLCRNYKMANVLFKNLANTLKGTDCGVFKHADLSVTIKGKTTKFIAEPQKTRGYGQHKTYIVDWRYK